MDKILILYYSRHGATKNLANEIAKGVESQNAEALIRTVPEVSANTEQSQASIPESGDLFIDIETLNDCDALIMGSPTRFGNMAAPLKFFLDSTSSLWLKGALNDKPAAVFTSGSSMHGGQESTLLSMMIPLLHHGMIITGIPYTEPALLKSTSGGSPYGASHVASSNNTAQLTEDEAQLAYSLGARIAKLAKKLSHE